MASGAGFLSAKAKAANAAAGVGFRLEGTGSSGLKGAASGSCCWRWRLTARQGAQHGCHGGEVWVAQRVVVTGRLAGWRHQQRAQPASASAATTTGGLNAEFCGRRSTRLVSKFHHERQKLYMVSAYKRSRRCREALKVFQAMKKAGCKPNLIMYNTIIDACRKGGVGLKKALDIFEEMQKEGVELDRITWILKMFRALTSGYIFLISVLIAMVCISIYTC